MLAYLIGSFPSGYVLTKYFNKIDITKEGSGNIGATNVLRSGSKSLAIITLALDALKGALPVIIFGFNSQLLALAALFSFLGHNFPVWLKFKGGKGDCNLPWDLFCFFSLPGFIVYSYLDSYSIDF